jgi:hypothetical protein
MWTIKETELTKSHVEGTEIIEGIGAIAA